MHRISKLLLSSSDPSSRDSFRILGPFGYTILLLVVYGPQEGRRLASSTTTSLLSFSLFPRGNWRPATAATGQQRRELLYNNNNSKNVCLTFRAQLPASLTRRVRRSRAVEKCFEP